VKDPTSDMATCARNGSAAVASQREKREGMKSRQRFWELGGTAMGNALGLQVGVVGWLVASELRMRTRDSVTTQRYQMQPSLYALFPSFYVVTPILP